MSMKLTRASDSSLFVTFGEEIAPAVQSSVHVLFRALRTRHDVGIRNLHPGYVSLIVDFDPLVITYNDVVRLIDSIEVSRARDPEPRSAVVEIPVCYDADFGPDQADVASHAELSVGDVIEKHWSARYAVAFMGFTAGFAYLSGLPSSLSVPRLKTPRRAVAAGSVGIAGNQTGVYPTTTPGGWRLIGRTPRRMFDPRRDQPSLVMPGDSVKFLPINREEFDRLWSESAE
jgi:KipI family sensor histidine kinase inhibitor